MVTSRRTVESEIGDTSARVSSCSCLGKGRIAGKPTVPSPLRVVRNSAGTYYERRGAVLQGAFKVGPSSVLPII